MISATFAFRRLVPLSTNLDACQAVLDIVEGWTEHLTENERSETLDLVLAQTD